MFTYVDTLGLGIVLYFVTVVGLSREYRDGSLIGRDEGVFISNKRSIQFKRTGSQSIFILVCNTRETHSRERKSDYENSK